MNRSDSERVVFTVGHSTRSFDDFVELLRAHDVAAVADVRLIPKSRRYPHFADEALAQSLPKVGIRYVSFKSLGGRRRFDRTSDANAGWRNDSFRGYADFMQTRDFADALETLIKQASQEKTAMMCAEAVPWRCHRSLIGDALLVRGWTVLDIMSVSKATPHKLTPFAHVEQLTITYPPEASNETPADARTESPR